MNKYFKYLFASIALFISSFSLFAQSQNTQDPSGTTVTANDDADFNISETIFGHINDAYEWHILSVGKYDVSFHLPVILYSPTKGWSTFSSSKFGSHSNPTTYEGYELINGNSIQAVDGSKVYDISITKNVLALLIGVLIILYLFLSVAKKYKQNEGKAPSGFQNAVEVCIEFVRKEVAEPALGKDYMRFMPILLSIFFFIWVINLLGMIPGGANVTGNIAVTACLAIFAFILMLTSSKAHYWKHLLNPPGMPIGVKIVLVPIEIISMFIKPIALMVRLFANMLAGHIVLLCFVLLIFIFAKMNVFVGGGFSIISLLLSVFSTLIEVLVTAIQAYIFTFLTAIFVGQMFLEEGSEEAAA